MDETPDSDLPPLRFLRILVTTLTVVMIVGFLVLIGVLVTQLSGRSDLALPERIVLPDGTHPVAFTQTTDWYAVITQNADMVNEILIFDPESGALLKTINLETQK